MQCVMRIMSAAILVIILSITIFGKPEFLIEDQNETTIFETTETVETSAIETVEIVTEVVETKPCETTTAETEPPLQSLGIFKLTAYCRENYPHICNDGDATLTSTGTCPTPGKTIAVDPKVIPYGTEVIINDQTYVAEDCGGAIKRNRIDICFNTHAEALSFGVQYAEVFVKN